MGIYILGMHRSGTSAYTRTVGRMVGYEEPEAEIKSTNQKGQWENVPLRHANEDLLRAAGSDWSAPGEELEAVLADTLADPVKRDRHAALLRRLGPEPWVWKDPRTCLTVSLWLSLSQSPAHIATVVRHPLEVAHSLSSRNGFPVLYGVALWERYNRTLIEGINGRRALFTSFHSLITTPTQVIDLTRAWIRESGYELTSDDVSDQVDGSLRHSAESDDPDDLARAGLSPAQIDLYLRMLELDGTVVDVASADLLRHEETPTTAALLDTRRQLLAPQVAWGVVKRRMRWARYPRAATARMARRISNARS
ncbi:hypothetical protein [Georgenia deserti]|uniref:Sulfotransferase family protein n=1 Tax=Georgenia deserti TaxID=2093781 RepID=A0ABW4L1N5_9MICO